MADTDTRALEAFVAFMKTEAPSDYDASNVDAWYVWKACWAAVLASRPAEVDDWISVDDRMPSTEDLPNGDCPSVIALWKPGALAENLVQQMVITTAYLCKNVDKFTHWMNLPAAPSHTTNKEK